GTASAAGLTAHRPAPAYRNPLDLELPGGGQAASCADPSVLKGVGADRHWYLYCTSDALTAAEAAAGGITNVPMFRSTDLVHWTYAGPAFPTKPSWVSGFIWAPDVVSHDGHYLMYYAASDTSLPGGGSAVGVATSDSPTGPWTDAGAPVVPPTPHQNGSGDKRWEFDPEVIYANGHGYVYFGSYFGGVFARELSADGLSSDAASETPIAIDNRYEGTYIVRHDGWYYFLGSATNCCNGPLTGYAVFAARSRSPLGPFLDRDGRSILDARVGGTPVLTQNGNRWVGPGHNTLLTDYSGQQWIVYHAVDRTDPYYAGDVGYTKRPVLMDPLDWRAGWPVVRGGAGPSDSPQPGPAAQPGERTAYSPRFVTTRLPHRPIRALSDGFAGAALSGRWTWVRPPDSSTYSVGGGTLSWQTQNADLHPESGGALASVLTEPAPDRQRYVVETKVHVDFPTGNVCCFNYAQGGLLIYGDDGNYVKLTTTSIWNTRQTEFGNEVTPQPAGYPNYGNTVVGPVGDWTYLRIAVDGDRYTAYTSLDGRHWDRGGTWTHDFGAAPRIGLISMGATGFTTTFAYVRVAG
ncbi:MAG TPA: family 43 glycosylhydrolase, partial [Jatrophihabitans sp.]|nr:family 43 glycosylhydrolase [Jatrophihabitans sp.]